MSQKRVASIMFVLILVVSAMIFGYLFGLNAGTTEVHMVELPASVLTASEQTTQETSTDLEEALSGTEGKPDLINLNTADQALLETLPGIGPTIAKRIIEYRNTIGSFASKEEIMNISGIGKKKYSAIEGLITVGGTQ